MRSLTVIGSLVSGLWLAGAPCPGQSRRVPVGDVRINYVVSGDGPAVVLIHGWALSLREWDDQVAALTPQYRVVAYDRRGFGRSTGFADISADPGDLRALLDTLGIRSAVLVGHSAGAQVAIRFAAALPERVAALVLYGGGEPAGFPVPPPPGPGFAPMVKHIARQYGLDSLFHLIATLPAFRPGPHRSAAITARFDSIIAGYSGEDLLQDHPQSGAFPPAQCDAMRRWTIPTLFISGDHEQARWQLVTDSLVRWMPDARKVVVAGGGHAVHIDEPERFDAALLAFLQAVDAGR
jgi:3-oxoadipate enol-lactonase